MHRLFVAIRPPEPIRDLLIDAMDDSPDFRWHDDEQLHITLRFIGGVDRPVANDLADALGRIRSEPFELRVKGVGRFEQRSSGALWAGVEPKAPIAALAAKIERVCVGLGLEPEHRAFHPHITLARWKGRRTRELGDFLDRTRGLSSPPFRVTEFILFESHLSRHGAHYEEVANYPRPGDIHREAPHLRGSPSAQKSGFRPMSALFTPLEVGGLKLANRIVIAPMCQYSAEDGCMTDWHVIHLGQLALSGAALLTIEATAVAPEGRISYGDTGLWSDENEEAMARVLASVRRWSDTPIAIQLGHAGRKASTEKPWFGGKQIAPGEPDGWQTVAPSPIPFLEGENPPVELDRAGLDRIRDAFADAARRAARLDLAAVQLHGAHGYLLHQFLSQLSNRRTDEYGGSLENRMRFPLEVFDAVRAAFPSDRPVTMRVSGTDWVEDGWDIEQTIAFARALEASGCAAIHVSSGGLDPRQKIAVGPSYQVPLARAVKQAVNMPVVAVGLITDFEQAEAIVGTGDADLVALARGMLYDPRWPWHAAAVLGGHVKAPPQYLRSAPRQHRDLFEPE